MRIALGLLIAGFQTGACGAPPNYRFISESEWVSGPATVLTNGDVVYQPEWSSLQRWSDGETTTLVKRGQVVDGIAVEFDFNNPYRWAAAGDGGVFAACRFDGAFVGMLAILPGRSPAWWLKTGDEIPGVGTWVAGDNYGIAPSTSSMVFALGYAIYPSSEFPEGGGVLLSLGADGSDRGRRMETIVKEGDRTPDAAERFAAGPGGFWPAFGFVFPDEHNRAMLIANVRSEPVYLDYAGRQTLWRWTNSRGLERLLDPKIANVDGWAATPIINAWMSRGGVFAILAQLSKPGETSRNALLVFDDFETNVPRIAAMEGEVLPEGTIGRLVQVAVNESGSIAFGTYLIPPGKTALSYAHFIYHRTRAGETKLAASPLDCKPEGCFLDVRSSRTPQLTDDERVVFNAGEQETWPMGLFEFETTNGQLHRITSASASDFRGYSTQIGGDDAPFPMRFSNSAGRVVVGDWGRFAIFDRSLPPCPADLTCDGVVDSHDFNDFAPQYEAMDCNCGSMPAGCDADLNADGVVDDGDFVLFVAAYAELRCE